MRIFKSKSLNFTLVLLLTMSTCCTQASWSTELLKKRFSTVISKLLGSSRKNTGINRKKLVLGITAVAAVLVTLVYGFCKISDFADQRGLDNALLKASEVGKLDEVKRLHKKGANLECARWKYPYKFEKTILNQWRYGDIKNPMRNAVENGHLDVIQYLLDQGVDIESNIGGPGCCRKTPLEVAIDVGNLKSVKYLIENGADVYGPRCSYGPIRIALPLERYDIIEHLINNGRSFNVIHHVGSYWVKKYGKKYTEFFLCYSNFDSEKLKRLSWDGFYHSEGSDRGVLAKTEDLEEMLDDGDVCPCFLRQRALAVLYARYKENDPSLLSKEKTLRVFFATVPFNKRFLQDLYKVNAIGFIVQNNIVDKFGRSAMKACIQCCKDEDIINAIMANDFQSFGAKTGMRPKNALRDLKNLLVPKEDEEIGLFGNMLQRTKKRNKKVYRQLLKRSHIYARLGQTELPDGPISLIISFLDCRTN